MNSLALIRRALWRPDDIIANALSPLYLNHMARLNDEDRIPASAVPQLRRLCTLLRKSLPSLSGVILHGSGASSGFDPERSDLDVLVIVDGEPLAIALQKVGREVLTLSGAPHPLELSILSSSALQRWHHPCPHLFHFGEDKRQRFSAGLFAPEASHDEDLTMHLVVARERGIDLLGSFPVGGIPAIPRADFLAAVLSDFEWAETQSVDLSDYMFSNACRTMAFLREGLVLSKSEGRQWCEDSNIDKSSIVPLAMEGLRKELVG